MSIIMSLVVRSNTIKKVKKIFELSGQDLLRSIQQNRKNQTNLLADESSKSFKKFFLRNFEVIDTFYDGYVCHKIISKKQKKSDQYLIYIHGGGYFRDITEVQLLFSIKIAKKTNSILLIPRYPLTPENNCLPTYKMLEKMYDFIAGENINNYPISIMGDSAGGQIALSFAQYVKNKNLPRFKNIILISPSLDLSEPDENTLEWGKKIEKHDKMLSISAMNSLSNWWSKGIDKKNYLVSPIYGNFFDIGNIILFTGTYDILHIFSKRMYEKLAKLGIPIMYIEKKKMPHVWPLFFWTIEGRSAMQKIIKLLS